MKTIEGMNILTKIPIKDYTTLSPIFIGLGVCIVIIASIIFYIKVRKTENRIKIDKEIKTYVFLCILGLVLVIFATVHFPWFYTETGRYKYECTFDDNVSANYIGENFKIISIKDGIWKIENISMED